MGSCKLCGRELGNQNKSGYCTKCYPKSPQWFEYQRKKQLEYYYKHKFRKKAYYQRPEVKAKTKIYMKKYCEEHKERIREQKRNWARKNKLNKSGG